MAKKINIIDEAGKMISDDQNLLFSKKFYEQNFQKIRLSTPCVSLAESMLISPLAHEVRGEFLF